MAYLFVVLFILEGIILAWTGLFRNSLTFRVRADLFGLVGGILIIYALIGYPLIANFTGRGLSASAPDRDDAMPDSHLHTGIAPVD